MTGSAGHTSEDAKSDTEQMKEDMSDALYKSVTLQSSLIMKTLLDDGFLVNTYPKVIRRVERETTRSRIVSYPNGYWAKITVDDSDFVTYNLFNSGWLAKASHKIGFWKVLSTNDQSSVKQRDTVEATLGATYLAIDETIQEDMKKSDHRKFLKEMIKTDPDNLKAIAQLDMLDKGDGPGSEESGGMVYTPTTTAFSTNMTVSSGTITKKDDSKPASLVTTPISFSASKANMISFDGDEASIKVEPDGKVSFGDKMAEAIREVTTEKGELNGSE